MKVLPKLLLTLSVIVLAGCKTVNELDIWPLVYYDRDDDKQETHLDLLTSIYSYSSTPKETTHAFRPFFVGEFDVCFLCLFTLFDRDFPFGHHPIDCIVAADQRGLRIQNGRILARRSRKRRQHRGFLDCHVLQVLVKVKLRGGRETILSMSHEAQIAIPRQNLILRVIALDLNGEHGFLNLAAETFFGDPCVVLDQE